LRCDKKKVYWSSCKVSLLLFGVNGNRSFSTDFRKILKILIRPVRAVLFNVDGQTDRHGEPNSRFW